MKKFIFETLVWGFSGLLSWLLIWILLLVTNALPKIVENFNAPSVTIAFLIHLFASTILWILFWAIFQKRVIDLKSSLIYASAFSLFSWVLASVIVKPLKFWWGFLQAFIDIMQNLNIFIWHVIFGLLLWAIFFYTKVMVKKLKK